MTEPLTAEIGYIAGSAPTLDRRLDSVRAVVQQTVRPHQLISVSDTFVRSDLPIILDISASSPEVLNAVDSIRARHILRPWFVMRMSGWQGISSSALEGLNVFVYRNAINVRPAIADFLMRYPQEIRAIRTQYAVLAQRLPDVP